MFSPDEIDVSILRILRDQPKTPVAEIARQVNVARATAQSRILRMEKAGAISGYGPDIDLPTLGYNVEAFATLVIVQGSDDAIISQLQEIPEILEAHAVTGSGDLLCRIVGRSNGDIHNTLRTILSIKGIARTETILALGTRFKKSPVDLATRR